MTEIEYDFSEGFIKRVIKSYDIQPKDPQKRLRVLEGWLLDVVFEDMNMFNHVTRINAWLKQAHNLKDSYPIHEKHIEEIMKDAWAKYKYIFKTEIKPAIKNWKTNQIKKDLERMRFT